MRANRTEYLFSVNTRTPPTISVESGEEFTIEVRGAFDDVEDIRTVPTPFTPACDGHPLAPITGPIEVRGAEPGDVVAIDLIELTPFGSGKSAILRDFGVLRREFPEPMAVSCDVRDGRAWFGGRISLPLNPNLGTISTMPPEATNLHMPARMVATSTKRTLVKGAGSTSQFWSMMLWSSSAIRTPRSATASSPAQASNAA
jgi:acetamidase/formamidase